MVQANEMQAFLRSVIEAEVADSNEAAALAAIVRTVDFFRNLNRQEAAARMKVVAAVVDEPRLGRDVAADLGLDPSTVSRHIAALEAEGLIARGGEFEDRRAQPVVATETGREALAQHLRRKINSVAGVLAVWPESDRTQLARLLDNLINDLENRLPAQL